MLGTKVLLIVSSCWYWFLFCCTFLLFLVIMLILLHAIVCHVLWVVRIWWLISIYHMNKAILCTDSKTAVIFKNTFGRTDILCNHGNISPLLLCTVLLWGLRIWWYIKTMTPSIVFLFLLKLSPHFTLSYFIVIARLYIN